MSDTTIPGGLYLGEDGTYHDANGNPVELPKPPKKEPKTGSAVVGGIENYDSLSVEDILARLATATPEQRAAVLEYEAANKKRKGILEA